MCSTSLFWGPLDNLAQVLQKGNNSPDQQTRTFTAGKIFDIATGLCQTPSPAIPYALGRLTGNGVVGLTATNFTDFDGMGRVKASTQKTETSLGVLTSYNFTYSLQSSTRNKSTRRSTKTLRGTAN